MTSTYRAFLSYSHRDTKIARRIHADLEAWRIDRDLMGRETPLGPVPRTLRPIFRDREDFAGGGTLTDATQEALSESAFLIVLCSPDAAQSEYVNEEIRLFKAMGRADRIIPMIIAGEPGIPDTECFPSALTRKVSADGELLDEPVEPLAADAREQGDGRRRALAKVAAGLLGISFDEIVKRSERAQRRRTRILVAVAACMCVLAVAAGGFAWLSESRRVIAERHYHAALSAADSILGEVGEELIRVEGIQLETMERVIGRARSILDELAASFPDAWELKVSKVAALAVFGKALSSKGDTDGAINYLREAETLAEEIVETQPNDQSSLALLAGIRWRLGTELESAGDRETAIVKLREAVNVLETKTALFADQPYMQVELVNATLLLSSALTYEGRIEEAEAFGSKAITLAKELQASNPDEWRYRLLLLGTQVGQSELLQKQGDNEAARTIMVDAERWLVGAIDAMPDAPQVRRVLSGVQASLAMILDKLNETEAAEAVRQRLAANMRRLVEADAENRRNKKSQAYNMVEEAEALARKGAVVEAAALFKESLETLEAMAAEFRDDPYIRSLLDLSLARAAGALNKGQLYGPAENAARRLLELREAELALASDDPDAIVSVTLALYQLARAAEGKGDLEKALTLRHRRLVLEEQLSTKGADNRAALADIHYSIGLLAWRLSRRVEAIPHYERSNELLTELAAETPGDADIRVNLGHGLLNLGELRALTGNREGALEAFQQCLKVRRTLVSSSIDDPERLTELAWAEARLAQFGDAPIERWRKVENLLTKADESTPLGDLEEELLTVARITLSGVRR